uniref:Acyltransferase-like protein At1g54570ic n=1 Tax=Rhizophora mucronata TaxID=61149 RepID=A0A2P2K8Y5_RHIMU
MRYTTNHNILLPQQFFSKRKNFQAHQHVVTNE